MLEIFDNDGQKAVKKQLTRKIKLGKRRSLFLWRMWKSYVNQEHPTKTHDGYTLWKRNHFCEECGLITSKKILHRHMTEFTFWIKPFSVKNVEKLFQTVTSYKDTWRVNTVKNKPIYVKNVEYLCQAKKSFKDIWRIYNVKKRPFFVKNVEKCQAMRSYKDAWQIYTLK